MRKTKIDLGRKAAGRYLLALLSGGMLALSFPEPGISALAWIAFVPLFLAAAGASPAAGFRLGFTAGCAAYAGILYWLNIVMTTYGKLPAAASAALYLALAGYLALYPGVVIWLARRCESKRIGLLISFPLFWVAGELIRSYLLTGFPWANLGYSQYRTLPLIQISDLTGVYGVSFLVAFANVVFYRIWVSMRHRERYPATALLLLLLLIAATMGYGVIALSRPEKGPLQQVLMVQGNIRQEHKWDPAFQASTVATYERLTRKGVESPGTLVVWPESALPFFLQSEPAYAARVKALAADLKSYLLTGSPAYDKEGGELRYLNSAFLISPGGAVTGRSDKLHLVPFGEYVPLSSLLPFVNKLVQGIGDFSPGKAAVPLDTANGKIGVLVCFEGIFPEVSRAYVRSGATMLVNITNDAWFGRSSAPYQHLSMTVFRAVENRVPLVRAANTGISSVIDGKGHIRGMTQIFEEATLSAQVRMGTGGTFYSRYGDIFALLCLAASIALGAESFKKKTFRVKRHL
ncbi:apolipoprotein N-acyltransferase [Geoanaerobacter pelophilus]|uniref:Apolipoprotein N-acyltransferase n=2 Tax=Geoanaerobacter pelophilus TaxID=60036 RepID=A0ABQ0MK40_9BACT|nr:apolipoprotein N-acyltransferase [Geoanaerobacter pelophilus]